MRPIKITMTAFGPYKNVEVVDFSELKGHKLFVISGNTGAGKTTIFDAICFALYGDASGEDRNDTRMLRSDFADDDLHTSVEFEFEVKGRTYRVLRQLAHVKVGNKSATGDRYELYETTDGKEVPLSDRFIVSQVNNKIQEIIGLTKEQFSQIVMLPQGEFRKLLTSETENKEEILRRIFKTHFYKNVTEHLNQKRRDAQKLFEERGKEREIYINHLKEALPNRENAELFKVFSQDFFNTHQVVTGLGKEIEFYTNEVNQLKEQLSVKTKVVQKLANELHQTQMMNERFELLASKREIKVQMEQKSSDIQTKELKLSLAEKASHLEVYEKHDQEITNELQLKTKALEDARITLQYCENRQIDVKVQYHNEEGQANKRESLAMDIQRLQEIQPTVRDLENRRNSLIETSEHVKKLTSKVRSLEEELKINQEKKSQLTTSIKLLEEKVRLLPEKTEQISQLREKVSILKEYLKHKKDCSDDRKKAVREKEKFQMLEQELELLEEAWIKGQASSLALHLHDGEACPVCGSESHPKKASQTEEMPTKELLEQKRLERRKAEKQYLEIEANATSSERLLEEKKKSLLQHDLNPEKALESYNDIVPIGKALLDEIEELKRELSKLDQLKEQHTIIEEMLSALSTSHLETINTLGTLNATYQTEKAVYEQIITSIPEDLRSISTLVQRLSETLEMKQKLDERWKNVQQEYQIANEQLATSKANLVSAMQSLEETQQKKKKAEKEFHVAIEQSGFDTIDSYKSAKMTLSDFEALKLEIEQFKNALNTVKVQITQLEEELTGQEKKNLDEIKEALLLAEQLVDEIRTNYQKAQNYLEKALDAKVKILEADEEVREVEAELQLIKDLYDVVRGENSKKISFERFLQIEFLEKIIFAANERLKRLSNGQYVLVRSDRLEKRGKQSGLGLDVLDKYTGQFRDVKSLSGGEKFNASLCLALGMADVIQSYEGGISIETMFIDEGFGSLDEESLNKAIDTLIDLQQSGRMIGVISHVQELKQAIPAILEVKKTKEGYSETKFVLS